MRRPVIVGCAHTSTSRFTDSLEMLVFSTARRALEDAGLSLEDVDGVVTACSDQVDGRAISSMLMSGPSGGHLADEINLASSGAHALVMGFLQVASGHQDVVLVTTWGKASEGEVSNVEHLTADPYFERDVPISHVAAMGIQSQLYRTSSNRVAQAASLIAVKNSRNASRNARAVNRDEVTPDEVGRSAVVAQPLRKLEIAPECDGAYSFVLASDARGKSDGRAVPMLGVGWAADQYRLAGRDLVRLPHLTAAARAACAQAEIGEIRKDIDFFELHDCSTDAELLALEAVGLCAPGTAADWMQDEGRSRADSLDPSGGSLSGEAPFAGILRKVVEAVTQLRREAGENQLNTADRALVQMSSGFAGQFQTVIVLGKSDG
jgi:acetyl-CoA C-acetyltransferase